MTRNAEHVYTGADDLERIRQHIEQLPNGAHVRLRLQDGGELEGIVAARPIAQLFFGPDGNEGTNAVVRLEQPALPRPEEAGWRDLWVDRIRSIERLDPG
ncbi:MAG: DUF3247 family protein [Lysobacter sp.]